MAVVENALILAAIWKKKFQRTPFHILLSGLAITDLRAGLVVQPFVAVTTYFVSVNSDVVTDQPLLYITIVTIANASATYLISITLITYYHTHVRSVERWLYMSRKSLVTLRRGCFTAVIVLLIPVRVVVFCSLETVTPGSVGRGLYISITAMMLLCFLTTFIAYFIVLRIIRGHQQQVQANEQCPNFAQPAIN